MSQTDSTRRHQAGAFDVRNFIAMLIGIYGAVLVLMGLFGTSAEDLERAGGMNVNLWAGVGMLVVSAAFTAWARLRPVLVPEDTDGAAEAEQPAEAEAAAERA